MFTSFVILAVLLFWKPLPAVAERTESRESESKQGSCLWTIYKVDLGDDSPFSHLKDCYYNGIDIRFKKMLCHLFLGAFKLFYYSYFRVIYIKIPIFVAVTQLLQRPPSLYLCCLSSCSL